MSIGVIQVHSILDAFCCEINPQAKYIRVPVIPELEASNGNCSKNVLAKVAKSGGQLITGWDISWECDGLIEAEWHSVWQSPDGELVDITPRNDNQRESIFIPEPGEAFPLNFIPNLRLAIQDTPRSRALFKLSEMQDRIKEASWCDGRWTMTAEQGKELLLRASKIMFGVPPMEACPCLSGKEFQECCGRPSGAPWRNFSPRLRESYSGALLPPLAEMDQENWRSYREITISPAAARAK